MLQIICSFGAALAPLWRHCSNIWSSIDSPPWFNKLLVVWEQNSHWEQLRECVEIEFLCVMLNNVTFRQCLANNSRAKIWACFRIAYRNGIFRGLERYASFLGTVSDMYTFISGGPYARKILAAQCSTHTKLFEYSKSQPLHDKEERISFSYDKVSLVS